VTRSSRRGHEPLWLDLVTTTQVRHGCRKDIPPGHNYSPGQFPLRTFLTSIFASTGHSVQSCFQFVSVNCRQRETKKPTPVILLLYILPLSHVSIVYLKPSVAWPGLRRLRHNIDDTSRLSIISGTYYIDEDMAKTVTTRRMLSGSYIVYLLQHGSTTNYVFWFTRPYLPLTGMCHTCHWLVYVTDILMVLQYDHCVCRWTLNCNSLFCVCCSGLETTRANHTESQQNCWWGNMLFWQISVCARQHICRECYILLPIHLPVCSSICHTGGSVKNREILTVSPWAGCQTRVWWGKRAIF